MLGFLAVASADSQAWLSSSRSASCSKSWCSQKSHVAGPRISHSLIYFLMAFAARGIVPLPPLDSATAPIAIDCGSGCGGVSQGCALYNNWWPMLTGGDCPTHWKLINKSPWLWEFNVDRKLRSEANFSMVIPSLYWSFSLCSCACLDSLLKSTGGVGLAGLMYILLPMPCLFFGTGSSTDFITMAGDGSDWEDAAKFLTGFSSVGSIAIPAILRHAGLIAAGAMWIELLAFAVLVVTILLFQRASAEDEWS